MTGDYEDTPKTSSSWGEPDPLVVLGIVVYNLIGFAGGGTCSVIWVIDRHTSRDIINERRTDRRRNPWITFVDYTATFIFFWTCWPLVLIGVGLWYLVRKVRIRARRGTPSIPSDSSLASTKITTWRNRGWLVLLRACYMRSIMGKPIKGGRPSFDAGRREEPQPQPYKSKGMMADTHAAVEGERDIEQAKMSTFDVEFVRLVTRVTEISEEGIFRRMVKFL